MNICVNFIRYILSFPLSLLLPTPSSSYVQSENNSNINTNTNTNTNTNKKIGILSKFYQIFPFNSSLSPPSNTILNICCTTAQSSIRNTNTNINTNTNTNKKMRRWEKRANRSADKMINILLSRQILLHCYDHCHLNWFCICLWAFNNTALSFHLFHHYHHYNHPSTTYFEFV